MASTTFTQFFAAVAFVTSLSSCDSVPPSVQVDTLRAGSYHEYQLYTWNETLQLDFTDTRPMREDGNVYLCIPAAFTRATPAKDGYEIDGAFAINGNWSNTSSINNTLGSALVIDAKGGLGFLATDRGALITPTYCDSLSALGADYFQQLSVVLDGKAQAFKDKKIFVRRAIVEFDDGRLGVIESAKGASLSQFAVDLKELGVKHAMYTDMGSFDEGWYRYAGQPITIGRSKRQTELQTNWVILRTAS